MSLDKVIDRIEQEAEKELQSIELDTKKQVEQIIQNARKKAAELLKIKKSEIEKVIENLIIQENSIADLESKKIRLNVEKEILDTTYKQCLDALDSIPHDKVISFLLMKVKKELPDAFSVYSNRRDEEIVRSLSHYNYVGNIVSKGGIVVENKDGTMRLDYRYETIADNVWNQFLKDIANKLFR